MTKQKAKIWVKHNPATGSLRPWEVYFQSENNKRQFVASCETEQKANRAVAKCSKRNCEYYEITIS